MLEQKEVQGIIFKRQKYREADLLVKIMTKDDGIITMLVKGALRPKSKLNASVLNFSYGKYTIMTSGHGLSVLRTYKEVKQNEVLYNDLTKSAYVSFIFDLVDHAFVEYTPLNAVYDLVQQAVERINHNSDPEVVTQIVQLQLLPVFGVGPQLKQCVICGKTTGDFDFSIKYGGIICSDHFYQVTDRMRLKPKETAVLRTLGLVPINRLGNVTIKEETLKATRKAIDRIYSHTLDLNLKTKKFLDELKLFN